MKPVALLGLLWPGVAAAQVAHDPGGDRIESFQWSNQFAGPNEPTRHCTQDRIWCAELSFSAATGSYELQIIALRTNRVPRERRWRFVVPHARCCDRPGQGISIWSEIVRDGWDGALVGLDLTQTTGGRPGFFVNQRRLLLLHIPSVADGQPTVVLETPLSGYVEQPMCPYPGYPPDPAAPARPEPVDRNGEIRITGMLSEEDAVRIGACQDRFEYSTLFALLPSSQPEDQPPDLIVATVAATSPGRRARTPPGTRREPIERTEGDVVRDPACTFTRTYYFDAAQRRYVPDAPLPACPDYLEP